MVVGHIKEIYTYLEKNSWLSTRGKAQLSIHSKAESAATLSYSRRHFDTYKCNCIGNSCSEELEKYILAIRLIMDGLLECDIGQGHPTYLCE